MYISFKTIMKNIVFFKISLALVGLLCSGGQANCIRPISGQVKDIPNFTDLDEFDSQPMQPMFDVRNLYRELFQTLAVIFNNLKEYNSDIVKRPARNANTDITELPENTNVTIMYNNVTESHTQPNIYNSTISNTTPIDGRLINNNTKQNNDTNVHKFCNLPSLSSTWLEYSKIRKNSSQIPRLVFIFSAHTCNIYSMIKKQFNKRVNKLYTVYNSLLPRSFMASIVPGIRKYWLLGGIPADTTTEDVVLYVSLLVLFGMLLFVAFITIKAIRQLWNSRRKLKPQKEDLMFYLV